MVFFIKQLKPKQVDEINFSPNFDKSLILPMKKKWFFKKLLMGNLSIKNNSEFWLVTLDKKDLESKIHILYNQNPNSTKKRGFNELFSDGKTCLSYCARKLFEQGKLKFRYNYDDNKSREHYWVILGREKSGPFVLLDGNHRAINLYAKSNFEKTINLHPIQKVICILSKEKFIEIFHRVDELKV